MQHANSHVGADLKVGPYIGGVNVATTFTPLLRTRVVFAGCILNFALLTASCAKTQPAVVTPPPIDSTRQLQTDLTAATKLPGVQRGTWGVAVQSLARNERLFDLNPQTLMVPASVAKVVSVATAVDAVGWDYRFTTTLRASGPVTDGGLRGDLMIVGGGWSWDDLGYSTGAIFGALNLGENRMTVVVTPGAMAGAPATLGLDADARDTPIINRTVTGG